MSALYPSSRVRSKSPVVGRVSVAARPQWTNTFSKPRDDSPTTSRHFVLQQQGRRTLSPGASPSQSRGRHVQQQQPTPPQQQQQFSFDIPQRDGNQLELFGKLQSVVVQLSQAAVTEKSKLSHMEQQLKAYQQLVRDQDRMIDELRAMNAKLQKERDALAEFRPVGAGGAIENRGVRVSSPTRVPHNIDDTATTPTTKSFVQSLIDQLREEKRLRLQVEEQSSRMVGEQQVTIHRLEDRLSKSTAGTGGGYISPGRKSPRGSTVPIPAVSSSSVPMLNLQPVIRHSSFSQKAEVSNTDPLAPMQRHLEPDGDGDGIESGNSYPEQTSNNKSMNSFYGSANHHHHHHGAPATSTIDAEGGITMESASRLLEQIRQRHGL